MLKPFTFEGRFESGFAALVEGKVCALTAVIGDSTPARSWGLGVAVKGEPGYHAVPLHWCHGDTVEEVQAHAEALNRELFGIDQSAAALIVLSTMGGVREAIKAKGSSNATS